MRSFFVRNVTALIALTISGSITAASSQVYITTDTTLDSSNPVVGNAAVGKDRTFTINTSPTVNLISGGSVDSFLVAYNSSVIDISGGSVGSGGLNANDNSVVNISGGSVGGQVNAHANSNVNVSGGNVAGYMVFDASSVCSLSGGSIAGGLIAYDSSAVTVSGGVVKLGLYALANSRINISGGSFGDPLSAIGSGTITLSGGSFGNSSGINISIADQRTLTLIGSNLGLKDIGQDPAFGEDFALSGTLASGTDLSGYVLREERGFGGKVNLINVPEPSLFAFLLTGSLGAGFAFRHRRRD